MYSDSKMLAIFAQIGSKLDFDYRTVTICFRIWLDLSTKSADMFYQ